MKSRENQKHKPTALKTHQKFHKIKIITKEIEKRN